MCSLEQLSVLERSGTAVGERGTSTEIAVDPRRLRTGWFRKGRYGNLSTDALPDEEDTGDEAEGVEDDSPAAWEHEIRQVKRKLEMQPSSSSSLARPRVVTDSKFNQTNSQCNQRSNMCKNHGQCFPKVDVTSSAHETKAFCESTAQADGRGERQEPFTRRAFDSWYISEAERDTRVSTERGDGSC